MFDPAIREGAIERVLEHVDDLGHLDTKVLNQTASRIGCDPNTIRRWLTESGQWTPPRQQINPDLAAAVLHRSKGNIAHAYRLLSDANVPGLGSESTFRRFVRSQLLESHGFAAHGKKGLENLTTFTRHEPKRRNDQWQGDHTMLDLYVKHPRPHADPVRPWITTLQDAKSRLVVGYALTTGNHPNAEVITATLARAVTIRPTHLNGREVDGGHIGGVPVELRHDWGADFRSERVQQTLVAFGISSNPTRTPYTGHQNGKVERLHRTINEGFCAMRPGYVTDAERMDGKRQKDIDQEHLLTFAEFRAQLDAWIRDYNTTVHSSLGRSPFEAWLEDCHLPLRQASPEAIRLAMLTVPRNPIVQKSGIQHNNRWFHAAALPPVGTKVQIRHVAYEYSSIEVFDLHDNWLCTAHESASLSEDGHEAMYRARANTRRVVAKHASLGQRLRTGDLTIEQLGLTANPDEDPDARPSEDDEPAPGQSGRARRAPVDDRIAEAVPERNGEGLIDAALRRL